ncbi:AAA family ATPase [Parablautia sp. Marseille-Q6255]|uniref:AAA family ATPase n=1 Tax=Parablautia sp. Marseille-Q6255 TaxID=3039593 RepID=UPI0024BC3810|nr:AAA family ATPase [Parablautia sp. Marseille-Q6255]
MANTEVREGTPSKLALAVVKKLAEMKMHKTELAAQLHVSRSMVSQYLAGKYKSNPAELEEMLKDFLAANGNSDFLEADQRTETIPAVAEQTKKLPKKAAYYESRDYMGVMSVCQSCQEDMGLGIIIGQSGYGKSYALQHYAKMPKVVYMECDDTMSCRDLVEAIEGKLGIPRATSGTNWKRICRIREFLNVNTGYLLIIDEADKLINKYTASKMEILRGIYDQADVGIVIAGEPKLEVDLRNMLDRFANRIDFFYKLGGLDKKELDGYLAGWSISEDARRELASRAYSSRNGCFRLLDRTLNNVLRVMKSRGVTEVTIDIVNEASGMMLL